MGKDTLNNFDIWLIDNDWVMLLLVIAMPFIETAWIDSYFGIGEYFRSTNADESMEIIYLPILVVCFFINVFCLFILLNLLSRLINAISDKWQ